MSKLNLSHLKVENQNKGINSFFFSLLYRLVLKGLFMSLGTSSNETLGQFVNSDVVF